MHTKRGRLDKDEGGIFFTEDEKGPYVAVDIPPHIEAAYIVVGFDGEENVKSQYGEALVDYLLEFNPSASPATWQDRLKQESKELNTKIDKLHAFIMSPAYRDIDVKNRELLSRQYMAMVNYAHVLLDRLILLGK